MQPRRLSTYRSRQHVVHERAQAPPVHSLAMTCSLQDLGSPTSDSNILVNPCPQVTTAALWDFTDDLSGACTVR